MRLPWRCQHAVDVFQQRAREILGLKPIERGVLAARAFAAKHLDDCAMLRVLYATGMRVSELIGIRAVDLHLRNRIVVYGNKTFVFD